jgi:hypothetical protein
MATDIRERHPLRIMVEGLSFPESARWRDGWLWFSDLVSGQVRAVDGAPCGGNDRAEAAAL